MSSFGVTPEGFAQKELADIEGEVNDDLIAAFGPDTNVLDDAVFGQIVGIFSDKIAEAMPEVTGKPVGLIYLKQLGQTGVVQGKIRSLTEQFAEKLEGR